MKHDKKKKKTEEEKSAGKKALDALTSAETLAILGKNLSSIGAPIRQEAIRLRDLGAPNPRDTMSARRQALMNLVRRRG